MPELLNFSRDVMNAATLTILAAAAAALPFMVLGSVLSWRAETRREREHRQRAARRARFSATR